jgi:hypothetical protein
MRIMPLDLPALESMRFSGPPKPQIRKVGDKTGGCQKRSALEITNL